MFVLEEAVQVMTEDQVRLCSLGDSFHHLMGLDPGVVVSSEPAVRNGMLIVIADVVLISGKQPSPTVDKIELWFVTSA